MADEEKRIVIDPLPEVKKDAPKTIDGEEPDKKMSRKKPGRKQTRPVKPKKETHVMTEARKQALLKARLARAEKRKEQNEKIASEVKEQEQIVSQFKSGQIVPKKDVQNNLHERLAKLEDVLGNISGQMNILMSSGVYNNHGQAEQTNVQVPTELRQVDIMQPEESFTRVSNGGESRQQVNPDYLNVAPSTKYQPKPNFFF